MDATKLYEVKRLNYIGSKCNLYSFIKDSIIDFTNTNDLQQFTVGDLFSGTGVISFLLRNDNVNVVSNDIEFYSYIITYATSICSYNSEIENIIEKINQLPLIESGYISDNFSELSSERKYFSIDNAK